MEILKLFTAIETNDIQSCIELYKHNAPDPKFGYSPIRHALRKQNIQIVEFLFRVGVRVSASECIFTTYIEKHIPDIKMVKLLAENNIDITSSNCYGDTPLMIAVARKYFTLAKYLLDSGACVNKLSPDRETALQLSIDNKDIEMTKMLLGYNADPNIEDIEGHTPIYHAIANRSADFVSLLITHGAYTCVRGFDMFSYALMTGYIPVLKVFIDTSPDKHAMVICNIFPIDRAITNQKIHLLKFLVHEKLIDFNAYPGGYIVPLWNAMRHIPINLKFIKFLLDHGADPNKQERDMYPLQYAISKSNYKLVKLLLSYNADIQCKSLLISASKQFDKRIVELLIIHKCCINALSNDHETALITAIRAKNNPIIETLLRYGADTYIAPLSGINLTSLCVLTCNDIALRLVLQYRHKLHFAHLKK